MATLQTYYNQMPNDLRFRFISTDTTYWVAWCNQMLEELSGKGLMPLLNLECGVVPYKKVWINKPSGLRKLVKLYDPIITEKFFTFEEVNDKFKLIDCCFDDPEPIECTSIDSYSTSKITCDIGSQEANGLMNFLLVVTGGTWIGKTFVLSGNTVTDETGLTEVEFLHELSSAPDDTMISDFEIYSSSEYLMMKYTGSYTPVTAITDEVPVDNKYELRYVPAYLIWCAQKRLSSTSNETMAAKRELEEIKMDLLGERTRQLMGPAKGRRLVGFER